MARVRNLNYNGTIVEQPVYNGVNLTKWIHDGVVVWENGFAFKGGYLLSQISQGGSKRIYVGNRNNYVPSTNSYSNSLVSFLGDRDSAWQIYRTYAEYNGIIFCLPSSVYGSYTHTISIYDISGNLLDTVNLTFTTAMSVSCFVTHHNRIIVCPSGGYDITVINFNGDFTSHTVEYINVPYSSSYAEDLRVTGVRSEYQKGITEYFIFRGKLFNAKDSEITQITSFIPSSGGNLESLALKSPMSGLSYFVFTQQINVGGLKSNLGVIAINSYGGITRKVIYSWNEVYSGGRYPAAGEYNYNLRDFAVFPNAPLTTSTSWQCCLYLYLEKFTGTGTDYFGIDPKKQILAFADHEGGLNAHEIHESSGENFNDIRVSYGRSNYRLYTYNDFWNAIKRSLCNGFITTKNGTDSGFEYNVDAMHNISPHAVCVFGEISASHNVSDNIMHNYNVLMARKYWFNPLIGIVSNDEKYSVSNLHVCYYNPGYYNSDSYYEDLS